MEHSEDLGIARLGHPACIWQLSRCRKLAESSNAVTGALFQCSTFGAPKHMHGADYPKPTRLLGTCKGLSHILHLGWPMHSEAGEYLGPLPSWCGHRHKTMLLAHPKALGGEGVFPTASAAAYPPAMNWALAKIIIASSVQRIVSQANSKDGEIGKRLRDSSRKRRVPRSLKPI